MRLGSKFVACVLGLSLLVAACAQPAAAPTAAPKAAAPTAAPQVATPTAAAQPAKPTAAPQAVAPTAAPKPAATAPAKTAYPEKAVSLIVPYAPGGPIDTLGRHLSEAIKPYFPQPLVVVNRAGAGGNVGTAEVVRAKPDGYTLGLTAHMTLALSPHSAPDLPYKTPDDYQPVINMLASQYVVASQKDAPWRTLNEFAEYSRANPGKVRVGSTGIGSMGYIATQALIDKVKAQITVVPFNGAAEQVTALLGGHIEAVMVATQPVLAQVKAGNVKVVSVLAQKRDPQAPETMTASEEGFDLVFGNHYLVFGPKGLPEDAVKTVHDAVKKVMDTEAFKKFADEGSQVLDYMGPTDLKKRLQEEYLLYGEMLKKQ